MEFRSGSIHFLINIAKKLTPGCYIVQCHREVLEVKKITTVLPDAGYLVEFTNNTKNFYDNNDVIRMIIDYIKDKPDDDDDDNGINSYGGGLMENIRDDSDTDTVSLDGQDSDMDHMFKKVQIKHLKDKDIVLRKRVPPNEKRVAAIESIICDSEGMLLKFEDNFNQKYDEDEIDKYIDVVVE